MLLVVVGHLESRASNPDIAAVARQKGRRKNRCCNREFGRARMHDDTIRSARDFVHLATQTTYAEAECNRATGWMAGMQFGHRLKLSDQPLTTHHMRPPRLQLNSLH